MKRLIAIFSLAAAALLSAAEPAPRPNVVLIMADDLGYECIGANGGTSYKTPVLDALAAGGLRFTHCYAQPLCTPTRVQIMTGQSNIRNYVRFGELDPKAVTFGHLFQKAGYATAITGKWQLGHDPQAAQNSGFGESCLWQHTRRPPRYPNPGLEYNGVEKDFKNGEYGPDLVNAFALDFIERHRDRPFFLYYPMILTHDPYQPTPDSPEWDPRAMGEKAGVHGRHFGDMVTYMDKLIGRVVDKLQTLGLRERTLVLFLGDNGTGRGVTSRMGEKEIRGGKGLTTAAGMHVPLIVSRPGTVLPGRVCNDLIDTTDFLPTLLEMAGIPAPADLPLDGRSFVPQLRGEAGNPREAIYSWYSPRQGADTKVREFAFDQNHKLYRDGNFFDLKKDPEEKQPRPASSLQGEEAAAAARLQKTLDAFADARPAELDRRIEKKPSDPEKPKKKKAAAPDS